MFVSYLIFVPFTPSSLFKYLIKSEYLIYNCLFLEQITSPIFWGILLHFTFQNFTRAAVQTPLAISFNFEAGNLKL
jgi:hypothetical protein